MRRQNSGDSDGCERSSDEEGDTGSNSGDGDSSENGDTDGYGGDNDCGAGIILCNILYYIPYSRKYWCELNWLSQKLLLQEFWQIFIWRL